MPRLHTHYDNLKVARDAPPEVIKAAYHALAGKYHPDRNPADPRAADVMRLVNAAYEVLSNPGKRAEHDRWIALAESERGSEPADAPLNPAPQVVPVKVPELDVDRFGLRRVSLRTILYTAGALAAPVVLGLLLAVWLGLVDSPWDRRWFANGMQSEPSATLVIGPGGSTLSVPDSHRAAGYRRPSRAPSGEPWPAHSSYIAGYKVLFEDGLSKVTLDNTGNASDVYVKVYSLRNPHDLVVRWVFVKGGERFVVDKLRPGRYEIRYRDLDSGFILRSETFELEEVAAAEGTRVTTARVILQKGSAQSRSGALQESDF